MEIIEYAKVRYKKLHIFKIKVDFSNYFIIKFKIKDEIKRINTILKKLKERNEIKSISKLKTKYIKKNNYLINLINARQILIRSRKRLNDYPPIEKNSRW